MTSPDIRNQLGYLEQRLPHPFFTGWEIELVDAERRAGELESKIDSLLQLFSLHLLATLAWDSTSKGMRQRILLIAAIMHNPEIFIFDEPLSCLHVYVSPDLQEHGARARSAGKTRFLLLPRSGGRGETGTRPDPPERPRHCPGLSEHR